MAQVLESAQVEQLAQKTVAQKSSSQNRVLTPYLVTSREVLQLAVWFGLMAGLVETLWHAIARYGIGEFIFFGDSVFYVAPIVQAIVAIVICLPVALLAMRRRVWSESLVVMLLAFLTTYNTLLLVPSLHYIAVTILAGGIATQVSRWVDKHPRRFVSIVRSSIVFPAAAVVSIFIVNELVPSLLEQRHLANLPAAEPAAPNVLLIVLDTVCNDALDLTTDAAESRTPNLCRLAKDGYVFEQAHSTCPWTLPSHASMFTSRLPHELSSGWYSCLNGDFPTIAEWMRDRGYRTGGFVGNTMYCSRETGLDRGFIHYEDYVLSPELLLLSTAWGRCIANQTILPLRLGCYDRLARRRAPEIRLDLAHWLDTTDDDHPYFLMINLFDAHDPYVAPRRFQCSTPSNLEEKSQLRYWWVTDKEKITEQQIAIQRIAYEDSIAHLDNQVGLLLDELRQRGALENTLVIVTADHGEHFGDHNLYGHGNSLYEASIHVPMIVWSNDLRLSSGQEDAVVSIRDIPATIAEYVAPRLAHPFVGRSLLTHIGRNGSSGDTAIAVFSQIAAPARWPSCGGKSPVFRGPMKCVLYRGLKYIRNGDGVEEVYDFLDDPLELEDLSRSLPEDRLRELRELIEPQISK